MSNGTIKSLITEKNFGFITPEEGEGAKDIFFHATGLTGVAFGQLTIGTKVSFEVEQTDKGPRAVNVTVVTE